MEKAPKPGITWDPTAEIVVPDDFELPKINRAQRRAARKKLRHRGVS